MKNNRKIINDPVHGFITIPTSLIYELIEHPYFQRLRRIKQLGVTSLVYPGAQHTRFQHALGAMHLMSGAVETLRGKGHEISDQESEGVHIAILLHDLGHAPFSHVMEDILTSGISHEAISLLLMEDLNRQFNNRLDLAIDIFTFKYKKRFLSQLVSSQLDMDRLDYLKRDSFFSGVHEGVIGSDRIIKMLNVSNDELVVEEKGIYSIEKFLVARRLMYWQVYLHKTALVAERMLINIMNRAKELCLSGVDVFGTPQLLYFLSNKINDTVFSDSLEKAIANFIELDDNDISTCIKMWINHSDIVLCSLSKAFANRNLLHIEFSKVEFPFEQICVMQEKAMVELNLNSLHEASYFVFSDSIVNHAYQKKDDDNIKIMTNDNRIIDIADASDMFDLSVLSKKVTKFFFCYPKEKRKDIIGAFK